MLPKAAMASRCCTGAAMGGLDLRLCRGRTEKRLSPEALLGPMPPPAKTAEQMKAEHRMPPPSLFHQHGAEAGEGHPLRNYVRDLVLGFNDGLVSTYAVVAGVFGAGFATGNIAMAGIAAGIGGALSMGIGEYLSTKSQAEYYEAERRIERAHMAEYPDVEKAEMREYLAAKGLEEPALGEVVERLFSQPEKFLDVMMREEFGQSPQMERSPLWASGIIVVAFVLGAALSVLPFLLVGEGVERRGFAWASGMSIGGLLLAGATKSWVSGLPKWKGALEMAILGAAAAVVTYGVGTLIGVSL